MIKIIKIKNMKTKNSFMIIVKTLILSVLILISAQMSILAQSQSKINSDDSKVGVKSPKNAQVYADTVQLKPTWWFGVAGGANLNFYRGSTQDVNADLFSYPAFHNGSGVGLYLAPTVIYQKPNKVFGAMLQIGYDSRKGKFDQVTTPCNCPADLKTNLSYVTIEPSLRVAPFKGNFYLYGGPRLAFNVGKSFTYNKGVSVDGTIPAEQLKGDFTKMHQSVLSLNVGAGYDVLLSSKIKNNKSKQVVLSPFVNFHPYFGQNPRSIETWNVTTLRVGAVLKFGHVNIPVKKVVPVVVVVPVVKKDSTPVVVKPAPVVVVVVAKPIAIVRTYSLYFKFDKSNLDDNTIKNLDALIIDLKKDLTIGVQIKSYADIRGSKAYNVNLSERRGNAVVNYLISRGIDVSRINSQGLGETVEFNKNNDGKINESNYALNRRSNLIVVDIVTKK